MVIHINYLNILIAILCKSKTNNNNNNKNDVLQLLFEDGLCLKIIMCDQDINN